MSIMYVINKAKPVPTKMFINQLVKPEATVTLAAKNAVPRKKVSEIARSGGHYAQLWF